MGKNRTAKVSLLLDGHPLDKRPERPPDDNTGPDDDDLSDGVDGSRDDYVPGDDDEDRSTERSRSPTGDRGQQQ